MTPLPDFYIGAHAAVAGHQFLTRDAVTARATASCASAGGCRSRAGSRRSAASERRVERGGRAVEVQRLDQKPRVPLLVAGATGKES